LALCISNKVPSREWHFITFLGKKQFCRYFCFYLG
jgi:hypothetical protein